MKADQRLQSTSAKIPRRRRGAPKSRTGCSICRARHIKCDEAVPKCNNCVVAGWTCEYPTTITTTPSTSQRLVFINHFYRHQHVSHHVSIRAAPHDLPDSSPHERRALAYFHHRAAAELGGVCLPDLWSKYILSTSRSNEVIRHAVVALVVFHEDDVLEPFGASSRSKYALHHYSKGVSGLLQLKHDPQSNTLDITLMCCIIFGTIEMLRGNLQSALVHLHSGKSILIEEGTRLETDAASHLPRRLVDDILQRVESQILGLMDVGTFDLPLAVRPAKPVVPEVFDSVQDAFYLLETLHNQILHFFSHVGRFLVQQNDQPDAFEQLSHELREFETLFHNWETNFDHFTRRRRDSNKDDDPIDPLAILLLNILHAGVKTTFPLHRDCHMRQTDFDAYTPDFANIVSWCETYTASTSTRRPASPDFDAHLGTQPSPLGPRAIAPKPGTPFYTSTFSMSTGVVPTLFLCGIRCRDPVIRRKASDLLQYGIRKEGLWHSRLCSMIVDVCIRCEEDNALREMRGERAWGLEVGKEMGTEVGRNEVGERVGKDGETEVGVGVGAGVRVGSSVRAMVADGVITDARQISENARVVVDGFRLVGERRGEVAIRANVPDENGKTGYRSVVMVDQVWW